MLTTSVVRVSFRWFLISTRIFGSLTQNQAGFSWEIGILKFPMRVVFLDVYLFNLPNRMCFLFDWQLWSPRFWLSLNHWVPLLLHSFKIINPWTELHVVWQGLFVNWNSKVISLSCTTRRQRAGPLVLNYIRSSIWRDIHFCLSDYSFTQLFSLSHLLARWLSWKMHQLKYSQLMNCGYKMHKV